MITRFRGELEGLFKHNYLLPPLEFQNSAGLGWGPDWQVPGWCCHCGLEPHFENRCPRESGKNAYFWVPRKNQNFWNWGLETSILTSSQARVYEPQFKNHYDNLTTTGQCIRCHMSLNKNGNNVAWLTSRLTWCKEHRLWV